MTARSPRFERLLKAHPQNPMAMDYVLTVVIFRELYHQDLLDTTYYAHDSFLSSKRNVDVPAETRQRIENLTDGVISICDQRTKANGLDKDAFFERGYARGLHSAFITLVDHSFLGAARQGLSARNDSEQALKIDPGLCGRQDGGGHPAIRGRESTAGGARDGGDRRRGREQGEGGWTCCGIRRHARVVTNIDSRTVLSLFLRHDARYAEALAMQHGLAVEFPHDYLFRLEEANLTKDKGDGPEAIKIYLQVLDDAKKPGYFTDARLQLVWFGLADTQRGQNDIFDAAHNYLNASQQPNCSDWLRKRAQLNAGEMFDLLKQRDQAVKLYQMAAAGGGDQSQAETARRYLKTAYAGR